METRDSTELIHRLKLSLTQGVGPAIQTALLTHFGSASAVFQQSRQALLKVEGIGPRVADELLNPHRANDAQSIIDECSSRGIRLLLSGDDDYPDRLGEIVDSPPLLYVRGELQPRDGLAIAIVGSRRCSIYGRRHAEKLAGGLARAGFTIISGLARGIDAAAHRGALKAGGRTIAVLATGVRDIYPPEHAELAMEIAEHGALVSEFPLGQTPRPGLFPQRNRLISGLSLSVIIVEATRSSGALHTARHAQEQGRDVLALPGPVDSLASEGCHELIRDGATLIRNTDDVIEQLGPLAQPVSADSDQEVRNPRELTLNALETEILNLVTAAPVHLDTILRSTQLPSSRVLSTLTVLEMKRFVRRLPGGQFIRPE